MPKNILLFACGIILLPVVVTIFEPEMMTDLSEPVQWTVVGLVFLGALTEEAHWWNRGFETAEDLNDEMPQQAHKEKTAPWAPATDRPPASS